jgi:tetratricopeptide (TPR) repeat protein
MNSKAFVFLLSSIVFSLMLVSPTMAQEHGRADSGSIRQVDLPDGDMSAHYLEQRADQLRAEKHYMESLDYYRAALAMKPDSAALYNKIGISELLSQRLRTARVDFQRAIKQDRKYSSAYNNLGVLDYSVKKYGKAIKNYQKAISLEPDTASYYSNLGSAYFAQKEWKMSIESYNEAVHLDPDIFEHRSGGGIIGQIASPEDRGHFSYLLAKLYAKHGQTDRSLECLRRAMEQGYKGVAAVFHDEEFTELRKDPRFTELVSSRPFSIPE